MSELEQGPVGGDIVPRTATEVRVLTESGRVRYVSVIAQLVAAGWALRGLSQRVRGTYDYIQECSESVDRLADQAAALGVDTDTVSEHREAAAVMRGVLDDAEAMAAAAEDLATLFAEASAAHEADYGSVQEAANTMDVDMANRAFYGNR
ncbi:hypothetical protein [Streptomyces otsuchiensis]|uniref:hypothetical protein n=1 Tax=Streptomyces otsuchiensis TaxID=2681388 RepID=UPI0010322A33|nr:hypothetical protein [Streptomyces otsuchiensis]